MTGMALPPGMGPERPDWHDKGLCGPFYTDTGFDAWHGPDEDELARATADCEDHEQYLKVKREMIADYRMVARKICRECPVQRECLQFAMENEPAANRAGIWGGLTETQRSHIATRTAAKAA